MKNKADFHVHIDGCKPEQIDKIVEEAASRRVGAMALVQKNKITDTTEYAVSAAEHAGIQAYTGLETDGTLSDGQKCGIIAIGFDSNHPEIQGWLTVAARKEARAARAQEQKSALKAMGFTFEDISPENEQILELVLDGTSSTAGLDFGKVITSNEKNTEALALVRQESAEAWQEAEKRYGGKPEYADSFEARCIYLALFDKGKALEPKQIEMKTLIDRIHNAGGVVLYSPEGSYDGNVWQELKGTGIDGIMAWHASLLGTNPTKTEESDTPAYKRQRDVPLSTLKDAAGNNLLVLGGSDAQGKDFAVGDGIGDMNIGPRRTAHLEQRLSVIRQSNQAAA